ncbi:MAG TPA: fimbria/pilus outer membrane usher protein [Verrucomicrobiae bacterium]
MNERGDSLLCRAGPQAAPGFHAARSLVAWTRFALALWLTASRVVAELQTIPLPATLNQQDIGEVNARLSNTEIVSLDVRSIRARLERVLASSQFAKLPDPGTPWVTPAQLEAAGLRVRFDFENLALHLTVPPEQRRTETLDLFGTPMVQANRTVLPNDFSAYMNVRGGVDYAESSRGAAEGFSDPRVALENAFNLRGWVLENETLINPAPEKTWDKRDTRLIWDLPERRWRWTLGDLNHPVTGFQSFLPMAGLSLHREDSLQPYRVTSPLGQSSFHLKEDSKVEILVNGHTVQTLQLRAGPHQIRNFPLTGGANHVILRITDPVGRVEYVNATFFYDPGLLKGGESEFNYAAGLPSRPDADDPIYDYQSEPAASAYHRWGLTDALTVGVNGQATQHGQQAGAEVVLNTAAGVLDFDSAFTHNRAVGSGHAERLQYRYYAPRESVFTDAVLSLAVRHASSDFVPPDPFSTAVSLGETWDFQARYSQRLGEYFSAGLGYSEQLLRGDTSLRTCSLTVSHRWRRCNTDVTLQRSDGPARSGEWAAFFSLIINLGRGTTAYSSHDTSTHATRAEVQYSPPNHMESFSGALGVQTVSGEQDFYGNARYFGRRAEILLSQDSQTTGENRTSLRWGTAVVYAGGQFGLSRPVLDSFAIFDSAGSLGEEGGVGVQPQGGRYAAREDWLGPAVLPELTAYYNTPVMIEPRRPEADFDPQDGDLLLKPIYRSGTHVRIGRPASANVTVTLVWADGKPAALQSGTLTAPDGATTEFITNREGLAYLHGLRADNYRGTLDRHPNTPFTLAIPTDKNINIDLGTIQVPTTE